jgi:hypothetical protein
MRNLSLVHFVVGISLGAASSDAYAASGSCGIERSAMVYTGCGFTYETKNNRDTECGGGGTSKFIYDEDRKTSCDIARGQQVYTGCGFTYQRKQDRDKECGNGGTSKFIPAE